MTSRETYYWIMVDGIRADQFSMPDRLTTVEKSKRISMFANDRHISLRGVQIKEVPEKHFKEILARSAA